MQTTRPASTQATQPEPKKSYLVEIFFPNTGKRTTFRWPTRRQANRCAKDFAPRPGHTPATTPQVGVTEALGFMTFEGWTQVQGGAA